MTISDLEQVSQIDQASFALPWSKTTYVYEILENESAHMAVLSTAGTQAPAPAPLEASEAPPTPFGNLQKILRRFGILNAPILSELEETVVGIGGFWCAVGEAHISTIAVHPDWRGRGLGEALLAGMLKRGIALGASESVLEVRVSNAVAINLYRKYEYEILTRRLRYYRDNDEDAWLMQVNITDGYRERLNRRIQALYARVPVVDQLNTTERV